MSMAACICLDFSLDCVTFCCKVGWFAVFDALRKIQQKWCRLGDSLEDKL